MSSLSLHDRGMVHVCVHQQQTQPKSHNHRANLKMLLYTPCKKKMLKTR